ncbi:hypothetical protein D3C75_1279000 [compost metagenome]
MMLPSISVTMVMPVLVSRSSGRASSRARIRAISMCCQGPMLVPNQASLETVSRKSVSGCTLRRTSSGKMIS